jgi:hypothetical protein
MAVVPAGLSFLLMATSSIGFGFRVILPPIDFAFYTASGGNVAVPHAPKLIVGLLFQVFGHSDRLRL